MSTGRTSIYKRCDCSLRYTRIMRQAICLSKYATRSNFLEVNRWCSKETISLRCVTVIHAFRVAPGDTRSYTRVTWQSELVRIRYGRNGAADIVMCDRLAHECHVAYPIMDTPPKILRASACDPFWVARLESSICLRWYKRRRNNGGDWRNCASFRRARRRVITRSRQRPQCKADDEAHLL